MSRIWAVFLLVLAMIDNQPFLNIFISSFLFLSTSGPDMFLNVPRPLYIQSPMFSFVMNTFSWFSNYVPTNSHISGTSKSSWSSFLTNSSPSLNSNVFLDSIMVENSSFDKLQIFFPNSIDLLNNDTVV